MPKTLHFFYLLLLIFAIPGCTKLQRITFNIKTTGIKNGVFIVKNDTGAMVFSANIKGGGVKIDSQVLEQTGYHILTITDDAHVLPSLNFEVYLDQGHYFIELNKDDAGRYPKITSPSALQRELSAYYTLADSVLHARKKESKDYNNQLHDKSSVLLPRDEYNALISNITLSAAKQQSAPVDALKEFISRYPKNTIAAHIMAGMPYEADAAAYYIIYKTMSDAAQNSDDGKVVGAKLSILIKLEPGRPAPGISGSTPDGKPFYAANLRGRKIYLVEFWKSASPQSRLNHEPPGLSNMLSGITDKKDFGIISISLDHKRDWWTGAIADDKLDWPQQYSDLKGNESVNVQNWGISLIPTYYLVDANWHIVDKDILWQEIPVAVNQYLQHH
ncbi:MAG: thioredoxin-like domain-containing protein [Bacteroidota bacterium]